MQNQQDKKLVSFIIPVYDVPLQMLKECIQSIRALSLRSFEREIIIVDDGSTLSPLSALTELDDMCISARRTAVSQWHVILE